ncbi:MAG: response regulator [Tepidisphaerales bacterium]
MNVLIAEDDVVSRRLLRGHLERWGHTVTEAVDGNHAWELFNAPGADYPILVVDWMMPGMDGLELIRRVRAARLPRYTYLLMLTAKNQKEDVVRGMDAGADDYLTKPFDREELRARLQAGQRILELQSLLTQSEKSAAVGRMAVGVASEMAAPLAEAQQSVAELRSDVIRLLDQLSGEAEPPSAADDDAPPRPRPSPVDAAAVQSGLGPRFVAVEQRLHRVRELTRSLREFATADDQPPRPVHLPALVDETLAMVRRELTEKAMTVNVSAESSLPPVMAHPGQLKRAVYNVLSVLLEAAERESPLDIHIRTAPPPPALAGRTDRPVQVLDVRARCPEIAPDVLPAMFEPFALLGDHGCRPNPRTKLKCGLGLPAAYAIVREHGGLLEAFGEDGKTVLRMTLA